MAKVKAKKKKEPPKERLDNARVVMTCAREGVLDEGKRKEIELAMRPTLDPFDRGHLVRDAGGRGLMPAARRLRRGVIAPTLNGEARPRRYPAEYMMDVVESALMTARDGTPVVVELKVGEVSFETAFERTDELQRELLSMGLEVGGNRTLDHHLVGSVGYQRALGRAQA